MRVEMTATRMLTVIACIAAAGALYWTLVVLMHARQRRPLSATLLAGSILVVLTLNAEVHLLSWLPISQPLDGLVLAHTLLVAVLIGYSMLRCGPQAWRRLTTDLYSSFVRLLRAAGVVPSLALGLLVLWLGVFFLYGIFTVPSAWDALEYHVPMAVQPYQDGRVGEVTSDLPWPNAYPRGTELVWYWTLQWTGADLLFHPVLLAFGVQLLLGTYVLARRSGVAAPGAVLAMVVVGTTPVFYWLATHGYIDLAVAAGLVAIVALLAPPREADAALSRDWLLAALAFGQACLLKLPILAVAFAGLALLHALLFRAGPRRAVREGLRWTISWRGGAALLVIAASCHTYWRNWVVHGNPLYPARIVFGETVVFDGPVDASRFGDGAITSTGRTVAEMTRFERFYHAWTDFDAGILADSFGTFGPVLPVVVLPLLALATLAAVIRRHTWRLALIAMFVLCYFTPSYLPRYGIPMVTFAVVAAMSVTGWCTTAWCGHLAAGWCGRLVRTRPARRLAGTSRALAAQALAAVVVAFCWPGVVASYRDMSAALSWVKAQGGGALHWSRRDAFMPEIVELGGPGRHASPQLIAYLREHSTAGDVLVWNVRTFPALLYNRAYSNRVIHLPGTKRDCYPDAAYALAQPTEDELHAWLDEIRRLRPKHILVYTRSAYAKRLRDTPALGYRAVLREPADRHAGGMTLFERERDPAK